MVPRTHPSKHATL